MLDEYDDVYEERKQWIEKAKKKGMALGMGRAGSLFFSLKAGHSVSNKPYKLDYSIILVKQLIFPPKLRYFKIKYNQAGILS